MRKIPLAIALVFGLATGCGGSHKAVEPTGPIGDHLAKGCRVDTDCAEGNLCRIPVCDPNTHTCANKDAPCKAVDQCHEGMCDPKDGSCNQVVANVDGDCMTGAGDPGSCTSDGACQPLPSCYSSRSSSASLQCGSSYGSFDAENSTDANGGGWITPTMQTSNYKCATGETGPEVAYTFSVAKDQDVTVTLAPRLPQPTGDPEDPDLDLIILDGACTERGECMNPQDNGVVQGVTAGTAHERVTFHALAAHVYYIVIDGKNGAMGNYRISIDGCGVCQPNSGNALACNMSAALSGDTSTGAANFDTYTCGTTTTTTVTAAGKEQAFFFYNDAPVTRKVSAHITGASSNVNLMVLPQGDSFGSMHPGECDPDHCLASATSASGAATLTFDADSSSSSNYWFLVDTANASDTANYGIELSCGAYCAYQQFNSQDLDCTNTAADPYNNGAPGSSQSIYSWGPSATPCATGLHGPEFVYLFTTPPNTSLKTYTFDLSVKTPGKKLHLVVLNAGTGSTAPSKCSFSKSCASVTGANVASFGSDAKVNLHTDTTGIRYYWVIVDGEQESDYSDYTLAITSGC